MAFVSIVMPYTDRWYFAEVLRGATARLESAGHDVHLHRVDPSDRATAEAADAVERDFADPDCLGAIIAGIRYQQEQGGRALAWDRPVVLVGGSVVGFPTVMIDDHAAARMATEHLLGLGHTRVAHFAGTLSGQMAFAVHGRRAKGYRAVMEGAGLDPWVVENDFDPRAVQAAAATVLSSPDRPTAVFAVSDEIALAVIAAARDLGLGIGTDLSVVGVDDHPGAAAADLTTVRQQPAAMGGDAAGLLLGGLSHGPDPTQSHLQPISLVKRGSSGPPRASRPATVR